MLAIEGHTDNTGSDQINDPLSEPACKRSEESSVKRVTTFLAVLSILVASRYVPACTNASLQGKACNRRVELMLIVAK